MKSVRWHGCWWPTATGNEDIKGLVDSTLQKLDVPVQALFSTLGRTAARGLETVVIGKAMQGWIMELVENIKNGDTKTYQSWEMPDSGMGVGLNDVPGVSGSLDRDRKQKDQELPVRGAFHLEPWPERRKGQTGSGGRSPDRHALADPKDRWKFCEPFIPLIRVLPAAFM